MRENLYNLCVRLFKEIASIVIGHTFRGLLRHEEGGNWQAIRAKDILDNNAISDELIQVHIAKNRAKAQIVSGDVLMTNRGNMRAAVFRGSKNTLAASSLVAIKEISSDYDPDFIALYLNSEPVQRKLKSMTQGAMIATLSIKKLKELPVPKLSLKQQQNYIELHRHYVQHQQLLRRKLATYNKLYHASFSPLFSSQTP